MNKNETILKEFFKSHPEATISKTIKHTQIDLSTKNHTTQKTRCSTSTWVGEEIWRHLTKRKI